VFRSFAYDFFHGSVWKWIAGSVGALIALLFFGKNAWGLSIRNSILFAILVLLVIFLLAFIRFIVINPPWRSLYGDTLVQLKKVFAAINELKRQNPNNKNEIINSLVEMCNRLKAVFDRLTKSNCSVSIKVPIRNEPISGNAIVENLCRDYKHYLTRNTEEYKKQKHYVMGSTAYQVILNNVLRGDRSRFYYLNNNVPKTKDYQTTSTPAYPDGLPYKSELVYPILPMIEPKEKTEDGKIKYEIWGFLCIDCPKKFKFKKRYHIDILEGIADGAFDVIMKINQS
jgi:hypothetical protein